MTNHRKVVKSEPFWRVDKQLNPAHPDYRPASHDLNLLPGEWTYKKEVYEQALSERRFKEKNTAKLSPNIHPSQR